MSPTWYGEAPPTDLAFPKWAWPVIILRAVPTILILFVNFGITLLIRPLERTLAGERRPVTPWIGKWTFRVMLAFMGIGFKVRGKPLEGAGVMVSNHVSYTDILALFAATQTFFVAKTDVADWPVIGFIAKVAGTVFIRRDRRAAQAQTDAFRTRLALGQKLMFFPEGTSTDGRRVLAFKPTLFAAFFDPRLYETMRVQPVTVIYHAPKGRDPRFFGWWGDMDLGPHFLMLLSAVPQGRVELIYHDPVFVRDFPDRKALAAHVEKIVREPITEAFGPPKD